MNVFSLHRPRAHHGPGRVCGLETQRGSSHGTAPPGRPLSPLRPRAPAYVQPRQILPSARHSEPFPTSQARILRCMCLDSPPLSTYAPTEHVHLSRLGHSSPLLSPPTHTLTRQCGLHPPEPLTFGLSVYPPLEQELPEDRATADPKLGLQLFRAQQPKGSEPPEERGERSTPGAGCLRHCPEAPTAIPGGHSKHAQTAAVNALLPYNDLCHPETAAQKPNLCQLLMTRAI